MRFAPDPQSSTQKQPTHPQAGRWGWGAGCAEGGGSVPMERRDAMTGSEGRPEGPRSVAESPSATTTVVTDRNTITVSTLLDLSAIMLV